MLRNYRTWFREHVLKSQSDVFLTTAVVIFADKRLNSFSSEDWFVAHVYTKHGILFRLTPVVAIN